MTLSAVTNANPRIDNRSVSPSPESPNLQNVTPRQRDVLSCISASFNKEVARDFVSQRGPRHSSRVVPFWSLREAASSHAFEILHKDAGAKGAYNP